MNSVESMAKAEDWQGAYQRLRILHNNGIERHRREQERHMEHSACFNNEAHRTNLKIIALEEEIKILTHALAQWARYGEGVNERPTDKHVCPFCGSADGRGQEDQAVHCPERQGEGDQGPAQG